MASFCGLPHARKSVFRPRRSSSRYFGTNVELDSHFYPLRYHNEARIKILTPRYCADSSPDFGACVVQQVREFSARGIQRFITYRRSLLFRASAPISFRLASVVLLVALAIVRLDGLFASRVRRPLFAFRLPLLGDTRRIKNHGHHGHACFPKSGPINGHGRFDSGEDPEVPLKRGTHAKPRTNEIHDEIKRTKLKK